MTSQGRVRQFALFVIVGGASALIDLGLFELIHWLGVVAAFASGCSFLASTLVNYWANRQFVFNNRFTWGNLVRYFTLVAANLVVSMLLVFAGTQLGVDATLAKLASMCVIVVVNYFLSRRWVFQNPRSDTTTTDQSAK
jgi:putative flippase GtrA